MLNFQSTFTTNGAAFPATAAINVTAPGAADGTEITANTLNDLWGFMQGLMNYAGLTPSGSVETYSSSQLLTALKYGFLPAGMVVGWYGQNSDPDSLGYRFLKLHGQGILRANYAELDAAVYCGDGNNAFASWFYHADDAAGTIRNTTGVYLILADTRGQFLRAANDGRSPAKDPDARPFFPDDQDFAFEYHEHYLKTSGGAYFGDVNDTVSPGTDTMLKATVALPPNPGEASEIFTGTSSADETRPTNIQIKWVIKY